MITSEIIPNRSYFAKIFIVSLGTFETTAFHPPAYPSAKGTAASIPKIIKNTCTKSVKVTLQRPPIIE